jgi:hypothetical protein
MIKALRYGRITWSQHPTHDGHRVSVMGSKRIGSIQASTDHSKGFQAIRNCTVIDKPGSYLLAKNITARVL